MRRSRGCERTGRFKPAAAALYAIVTSVIPCIENPSKQGRVLHNSLKISLVRLAGPTIRRCAAMRVKYPSSCGLQVLAEPACLKGIARGVSIIETSNHSSLANTSRPVVRTARSRKKPGTALAFATVIGLTMATQHFS